jgi:hypothetical protein
VTEGDTGTKALSFTVSLSAASSNTVTVQFTTANGTATGGASCAIGVDYLTGTGGVSFAPSETSKSISATICGDAVVEGNETLLVNLSSPTNATILDGQATGTITDDDQAGSIGFSAAAISVPESAGTITVTVQRNGTATAGQDYTAAAGTLSFGVGETTKTIPIPILTDSLTEAPETFIVTLSSPTGGATIGSPSTLTVTITDATVAGSPPPASTTEVKQGEDDTDKKPKETEEQQQQRQRTNTGNRDDLYTEGNVVEVHQDEQPPYVVIGNKDGLVRINLLCGSQCPTIRVGDYLEADGEKQNEQLFDATDVIVKH